MLEYEGNAEAADKCEVCVRIYMRKLEAVEISVRQSVRV